MSNIDGTYDLYDDFSLRSTKRADGVVHDENGVYGWVAADAPSYGAVNGYVRLPDGHPWLAVENGYDIPNNVPWGEITYQNGNWIGFDSMHSGQYWPGQSYGPYYGDTHMDAEMVIEWTKQLLNEAMAAYVVPQLETLREARKNRHLRKVIEEGYGQVRMTKADLLAAIESYPLDAPIVVAMGIGKLKLTEYACWNDHSAAVWSVADASDAIVLEL